jgi:large subunit ribosomal protein L21
MFAVIRTGGKQYKVEKGETLAVDRLGLKEGETVVFDDVLLVADGRKVMAGTPTVKGASVRAEVLGEEKGDKVVVFKMKRRKGYRKTQGHRQKYSILKISDIDLKS